MRINISAEKSENFQTSYNVKINILIRHRYLRLVMAQLHKSANSIRKCISVFLDIYATRESAASERLHFFTDPTVHFIGLQGERLAVSVLSLCTELLHCVTRRRIGSHFLYSTHLCDRCFFSNSRQLRTESLGFVHFHKMIRSP